MIKKITICILTLFFAAHISCEKFGQNSAIEKNRSLWRDSKISDYKMIVKINKTGHATPNGKFIIVVRGGVAKSIKPFDKPELEMLGTQIRFRGYDTIKGIFNFIESAEKNNTFWDKREIEYDAKFGYPKKVNLDQSGVMDDELYFEVLGFEILEPTVEKTEEKPSPPKEISVPAAEITKAEFSTRSPVGSGKTYRDEGGMIFSNDGTAFRSYREINYEKDSNEITEWEKFQGTVSPEQFQKFAQILAENDFSKLKDSTEQSKYPIEDILIVTYSGKTKSVNMSNIGKDTAEVKAIRQAFETLKNQIDWKQIE